MPLTLERWSLTNPGTPEEDAEMELSKINVKDLIGAKILRVGYPALTKHDHIDEVFLQLKDGRKIYLYAPEALSISLWDCDQPKRRS